MELKIRDLHRKEITGIEPEKILNIVEEYLVENNLLLNSIIVDNVEVFDDFLEYLELNVREESKIEVITLTQEELSGHLKKELQVKIAHILSEINMLSLSFYSIENRKESFENLSDLIMKFYELIKLSEDYGNFLKEDVINLNTIAEIKEILQFFYQAIEQKDFIYIADILHFELKPIVEKMLQTK